MRGKNCGNERRTPETLETLHACHWHRTAGNRLVLLSSPGLGHSHKYCHGRFILPISLLVDARDGGEAVEPMAANGLDDMVYR